MKQQYILKAGDSLEAIAHQAYDSVSAFREIADENNIDIFSALPIGEPISLPPKAQVVSTIRKATVAASSLDLSSLKQPEAVGKHQLVSWVF